MNCRSKILISPSHQDVEYAFCYNAGLTFENSAWYHVNPTYTVKGAPLKFAIQTLQNGVWTDTGSNEVLRTTTDVLRIDVERTLNMDFSDVADWAFKIVEAKYACSLAAYSSITVSSLTEYNGISPLAKVTPSKIRF